ncbi:molecular chaperone HtpG [Butyricimonas virosa]|uniref:Chaperone protein HtpG n=3 Tax=Butyricimonas TaxID=574697 RepID=A0A413IIZ8_9BACT|nr:molecular chaperone HtpG [Butyricimonas virosa]MCI7293728.1 molecular chaperone HtpG [Butyricimonas virosa]MDY6219501.1 molecular chaperone HtpG [Butyricimonas virosa]QRO49077.1 molecular chaperone HtpG [Butyricimonas virosa]RGL84772.1 molecular chaperone HtpG [Butyricimonas virosa]RGY13014.1 molecular chaperone HtpG [Butyricimonas virosa]
MSTGKIGVSTGNLFPIIKKFLYSDHEIFLREIVSNAVDASQKMKVLASNGEFKGELGELKVRVKADKAAGTLTVSDNGIGMTEEEVEKYINQIAFSGAEEFMNKYKDNAAAIIGHFGLGFYSSFMVSDRVEIVTKSYKEGAKAVKWSCEGNPEYTLEETEKAERGTDIIMYISEEEKDFLEDSKVNDLLTKYCKFLPIEIISGKKKEWKDGEYKDTTEDNVINDTNPAWTRKPTDLTEEDYEKFYRELYPMAQDPLFHIHLNVDYPFNLTGILYFPKIDNKFEIQKNKIQLYSNQVYVTDSVEGIVPEYLTLLHGVIDSPDIPLNVSRSYLQSDRNVKKISSHITKKVADSLSDIFTNKREDYEKKWDDLKIFIQYGMLTDEKFAERAKSIFLFKNTEGKYFTYEEYENLIKANQTDKDNKVVFLYATDVKEQYTYIETAKGKGYDVLLMDGQLDTHFINHLEQKNSDHRFVRVDSDVIDKLIPKEETKEVALSHEEQEELRAVFTSQLPKEEGMFMVNFEAMGENGDPVIVTRSEFMRRMKEMAAMNPGMGFYGAMGDQYTLVVNTDHKLVNTILENEKKEMSAQLEPINFEIKETEKKQAELDELNKGKKDEEIPQVDKDRKSEYSKTIADLNKQKSSLLEEYGKGNKVVGQLIDLALLANGLLKGEALNRFVKRSVELIK